MKIKNILAIIVCLLMCYCKTNATNLSADLTVDDAFKFYISTNDNVAGNLIGQGNTWTSTYSFNSGLTPNVVNYLHIEGSDVYGVVAAFLGDFTLSDANFKFANGGQYLLTNTSDWNVYTNGFGNTPGILNVVNGQNGVGPWGFRNNIDPNANWIWTNNGYDLYITRYFSTPIYPGNQPVPEPITLSLFGCGLIGLFINRKK